MNKKDGIIIYNTLEEQYRDANLPVDLIHLNSEFTIFNLADLRRPMPFSLPASRLNFFVFGFIKDAQGNYTIDHQTFQMRPGTIYFTNPGHLRSWSYSEIGEVYLVTVSEAFLKENIHADIFTEFPFLLAETLPAMTATEDVYIQFERLYLQIHQEYNAQSPFRKRLIGSLFFVLLLKYKEYFWLKYNAIYEGNRGSEIVKQFNKLLEKHYRDLAVGKAELVFRLQDYAQAQGLHPNYLSNVIKSKTGKTVGTWIAEKTIAEAKSLLKNTDISIKEITFRLGFTDTANFSTYFKKNAGISPLTYRKQPL